MIEDALRREFFLAIRIPGVRLFRRHIAMMSRDERTFRAGIKGQADAYGYVQGPPFTSHAIPFEIEFKGRRGKLSDEQEAWRDFCLAWGIPWLLLDCKVHESDDEILARWAKEFQAFVQALRDKA